MPRSPTGTSSSHSAFDSQAKAAAPPSGLVHNEERDLKSNFSRDQPLNVNERLGTGHSKTVELGKMASGSSFSDKMGPSLGNKPKTPGEGI
jgi:hypothetical protein